jgi:transposase
MEQEKKYCGIDISNLTMDISFYDRDGVQQNLQLSNSIEGFKKLLQMTCQDTHFVMESTGVYHLNLIFFLHKKKYPFSVVNGIQIKRFIQMNLERNKSDKKDAKRICDYGYERQPEVYEMPDRLYFECKSLSNAIHSLTKEITAFSNKIHALSRQDIDTKEVLKAYKLVVNTCKKEIEKLEDKLYQKLNLWEPNQVKQVSSVMSIGKRATALLIIKTQGFKHTQNYKQLISYAGLSPAEYSSGSSIKGRTKICKQGGDELRHTLYMYALNAKANNLACKQLYERLVAKGKNKKLAIIAVCNKLLKQVFGVVKNGTVFDNNYLQKIA